MRLIRRLTISATLIVGIAVSALIVIVGVRYPAVSRQELFGVGVLVTLIGAGLARVFFRSVTRPLEDLRDAARAIASGDLELRPPLLEAGEVGELSDAFRRMAEQAEARMDALQAEEALLVALTESLNEGVVAVNARQQVVRINETARQLLRLRDAVPFPTDYLPRDRTLREAMETALEGADAAPGEARVDDRVLSLTARPLAGGGAVLALYDLTPFRKLEAVRRDFVANVSHELRTPLTVISGFVETLQDENIPSELRQQFVGMAAGNVRRMQRIVDDLLDLSRIESGGWLPNPAELDVRALANEILAPLQETAAAKGVALEVCVGEDAREVYVDPTAVRQVLSNLAENALRHTAKGSVQLFSEKSDNGIWLGARDTGTGIGEEHLSRIFERFYRADRSRSRDAGGTGLGLAIVKHLAEAHGGKVRAESALERGTTIAAWFPLGAAESAELGLTTSIG